MSQTAAADRPVVVTGAASGMGRAVALLAAGRGHPVVLVDRDERALPVVAAELEDHAHLAVVADVSDRGEMGRAFALGADCFGPCWALAAVAGVIEPGHPLTLDDAHVARMLGVNVVGVVLADHFAARQMRDAGRGGRIVNWASDAAVGASPGYALYAAAKSAVVSLTRTFAVDLAPLGITVNAIMPGVTDTPLAAHLSAAEKAAHARAIPDGRWADPAEIAWFFGILLADESRHMTGETLLIDGGATARMGRDASPLPEATCDG